MLRNIDEFDRADGAWRGMSARAMAAQVRIHSLSAQPATDDPPTAEPPSLDELAFRIAVGFRQHGHIGNVLTHICGRDWTGLEHELRRILNPESIGPEPSPLARNILELLCADRGVTARIMRPYFRRLLTAILGDDAAIRLVHRIDAAFAESECAVRPWPAVSRFSARKTDTIRRG